jgi:Cu/Ag efflux pump CusA
LRESDNVYVKGRPHGARTSVSLGLLYRWDRGRLARTQEFSARVPFQFRKKRRDLPEVLTIVIFGMPLSVSAAIPFMVLLKIAVQNGMVLRVFIAQLRNGGMALTQAVRKGCNLRFRLLLMTALTTFIAHVPMLYASGSGENIRKPVAVVVNGGNGTSTSLTLVVMPAMVLLVTNRKKDLGSA